MTGGRLAARLYRFTLRAFPSGHRAVYGDEMVDAFARALDTRRHERGRSQAMRFLAAACADAVRSGLGERRRHSRLAPPRRPAPGSVGRDLAHAVRALARARTFTFVSVVSLGIGIGVVFTMLLFVRIFIGTPPGFTPAGLVELLVIPQDSLRAQVNDWAIDTWAYPDFEELRAAETGMTLAGWTPDTGILRVSNGPAVRVDAMYVSPNYFPLLDVPLARGPGFTQREPADEPEVIVAHRLWRNRLDADPGIVGRTIVVNGTSHVVVGVLPERFRGHLAQHRPGFELFLPLARHPRLAGPDTRRVNRTIDWVQVLGRLSPGRTRAGANAVVASIMAGFAQRYPETNALKSASVEPYYAMGARRRTDMVAEGSFVLGAACLVLLVVCLNMSGMVLVRSASRERELAVRLAIGASRGRLMQYLLSESVVLALLGGALAVAVIFGIPLALTTWAGTELDEFGQLRLDAPAIAFSVGLCLAASLVFGLLPAIRFSRPKVMAALKDEAGGGGRRVGRIQRWTVAVQAGLAVPFLVVGGVQLDQFRRTANADLGFDPAGLFALPLDPAAATRAGATVDFVLRSVQANVEQASGVSSVTVANGLPLDGLDRRTRVVRDGAPASVLAQTTRVAHGYLETMGVLLVRGRGITSDDRAGSEQVVVISQALAARLFPDGDPVGGRVTFALEGAHGAADVRWTNQSVPLPPQTFTVVGVTGDMASAHLGPPKPQLFVPLTQYPASRVYVIARSSASLQGMTSAFERAVTGTYTDPDVVAAGVVTGERLVRRGRSELVMGSTLSAVAGGAALLLAALGIFGVVGFMVATRTREIGIRIALGASRSRVLRGVLADAAKLASWGVAGGLGLAFLWEREMSWSSIGAVESLVYVVAVAIALGVAMLASLPAARRAAAVEPIIAMRAE